MKLVIQRCKKASVFVEGKTVGKIDYGCLILVGFENRDTEEDIDYLIDKVLHLRIFDDENKAMNRSLLDINGSVLSVSQFTLYAETKKGRRPSYDSAMKSDKAISLYELWNQKLSQYVTVETGIFGADMEINLIGDGPVTIIMESREKNDKK